MKKNTLYFLCFIFNIAAGEEQELHEKLNKNIIAATCLIKINTQKPISYQEYPDTEENIPPELIELYALIKSNEKKAIHQKEGINKIQFETVSDFSQPEKEWTILIYIAGDNDLYRFALRNIEQMKEIGSNDNFNIVIHFDFHQHGQPKETRRLYIQQGKIIQIGTWPAMDSGSDKTVIDFAQFAIPRFPSKKLAYLFWNHGSGQVPLGNKNRLINPSELFYYDVHTNQFLVDRSISFLDFCEKYNKERGVCYDNTTGNYLDDDKLKNALSSIVKMRNGELIDVILFDACLMGGLEIMYVCAPYAKYFIASQEVVLGPGYNYAATLKRLARKCSVENFVNHVVETYAATYQHVTPDFCEAGIKLNGISLIVDALNDFVKTILNYAKYDTSGVIRKMLLLCSSKEACTHFDEPSYIDLKHFLDNILAYSKKITIENNRQENFYNHISKSIFKLEAAMHESIMKNVNGKNLPKAHGISIYVPKNKIHKDYYKTLFGKNTLWPTFLHYMKDIKQ